MALTLTSAFGGMRISSPLIVIPDQQNVYPLKETAGLRINQSSKALNLIAETEEVVRTNRDVERINIPTTTSDDRRVNQSSRALNIPTEREHTVRSNQNVRPINLPASSPDPVRENPIIREQ